MRPKEERKVERRAVTQEKRFYGTNETRMMGTTAASTMGRNGYQFSVRRVPQQHNVSHVRSSVQGSRIVNGQLASRFAP